MAPKTPEQLTERAKLIEEGRSPGPVTVRELLSWFGAKRRGFFIVQGARSALKGFRLSTEPDFDEILIDSQVKFVPIPKNSPEASAQLGAWLKGSEL